MLIFLDDFIYSLQSIGGVSVYWTSVLEEIHESKKPNIFLIRAKENKNILAQKRKWGFQSLNELRLPLGISRILFKSLPAKSIFHSSYLRISLQRSICNVITIHDLAAELGYLKGIRGRVKKELQAFAIRHADGIICVSEATKKSLLVHYPQISDNKIQVIHHGCSDIFRPIDDHKHKNIILFVGHRKLYKNFDICVQILEKLPQYELLIISGEKFSTLEYKALKNRLGNRFRHIENVDTATLNNYYNDAFCLLYSSCYEGFGMPVLEAMKAGCPVIASDIPALREVAADGAILIEDFLNAEAYIKPILDLKNQQIRKELIDKGVKRAESFSWKKHIELQFSFYNKTYRQRFG